MNNNKKININEAKEVNGGRGKNIDIVTAYNKYADHRVGRYLTKEDINSTFFVVEGGSWLVGTLIDLPNDGKVLTFQLKIYCITGMGYSKYYKLPNMNDEIYTLKSDCGL